MTARNPLRMRPRWWAPRATAAFEALCERLRDDDFAIFADKGVPRRAPYVWLRSELIDLPADLRRGAPPWAPATIVDVPHELRVAGRVVLAGAPFVLAEQESRGWFYLSGARTTPWGCIGVLVPDHFYVSGKVGLLVRLLVPEWALALSVAAGARLRDLRLEAVPEDLALSVHGAMDVGGAEAAVDVFRAMGASDVVLR